MAQIKAQYSTPPESYSFRKLTSPSQVPEQRATCEVANQTGPALKESVSGAAVLKFTRNRADSWKSRPASRPSPNQGTSLEMTFRVRRSITTLESGGPDREITTQMGRSNKF